MKFAILLMQPRQPKMYGTMVCMIWMVRRTNSPILRFLLKQLSTLSKTLVRKMRKPSRDEFMATLPIGEFMLMTNFKTLSPIPLSLKEMTLAAMHWVRIISTMLILDLTELKEPIKFTMR